MSEAPATFPRRVTIPIVLVVAALMALLIWSPFDGEAEGLRVGQRVTGMVEVEDSAAEKPLQVSAPLPSGTARFTVTTGSVVRTGHTVHRTSGDFRFVTVAWNPKLQNQIRPTVHWPVEEVPPEPTARVVLVAGGETYALTDGLRSSTGPGAATVVVKETRDLAVQVEVDGVRRTARPGQTADFSQGSIGATECTDGQAECRIEGARAAYVPGLGMAPDGKDWLVVEAEVRNSESEARAVVHRGHSGSGGGPDYVADGEPTLTINAPSIGSPVRTAGEEKLTTTNPRLETRAYQVPSDQVATVGPGGHCRAGLPDRRCRGAGSDRRVRAPTGRRQRTGRGESRGESRSCGQVTAPRTRTRPSPTTASVDCASV